MVRYQIILTYDGTRFSGSQRQADSRTVQHELEKALSNLGWKGRSVLLAGRTDSGVHARGQVAAFDLDWKHDLQTLLKALNSSLPKDMAVSQVQVAADGFHPRFNATSRRYRYRLFCQAERDPLRERFAWRVWPKVADLRPLAGMWKGTHDFAAFGTPPRAGESSMRTVQEACWKRLADEWIFDIQANAFLYHMVRRIVHAQVAVGQGRLLAEDLVHALEGSKNLPSGLAPACGLTLMEVNYDDLE